MSGHHDDHALPGADPDPKWGPAAFWLAWGTVVVLISVLTIQYFVHDTVKRRRLERSHGSAELEQLRTEHAQQLAGPEGVSIEAAMDQVAREHRR